MKRTYLVPFAILMSLALAIPSYAGGCGTYNDFEVDSKVSLVTLKLKLINLTMLTDEKGNPKPTIEVLGESQTTLRNGKNWKPQVFVKDLSLVTSKTGWRLEAENGRGKKHVYEGTIGTGTKVTVRIRHFM